MKIGAIALCAGQSQRYKGENKLLSAWGEISLLEHTLSTLKKVFKSHIVAVTGNDSEKIESILKNLDVSSFHNENYQKGIMGSIQTGLKNLNTSYNGALIYLCDYPYLSTNDIQSIVQAYPETQDQLLAPRHGGEQGTPVIIGQNYWSDILQQPHQDKGCKYLFNKFPDSSLYIEMPNRNFLMDIDTLKDR